MKSEIKLQYYHTTRGEMNIFDLQFELLHYKKMISYIRYSPKIELKKLIEMGYKQEGHVYRYTLIIDYNNQDYCLSSLVIKTNNQIEKHIDITIENRFKEMADFERLLSSVSEQAKKTSQYINRVIAVNNIS